MFSRKYLLAGKPDYIVKDKTGFFPVEYKSSCHNNPQLNHILQLAAYCHLVEENYNCFVSKGVLVYNNDISFVIPFNPEVRFNLEKTLKEMRSQLKSGSIDLNHDDSHKCTNCSFSNKCKFKF